MSIWRIENENRLIYLSIVPLAEWDVGAWNLTASSVEAMEAEYDRERHNDTKQEGNDATGLLRAQRIARIELIDLNNRYEEEEHE